MTWTLELTKTLLSSNANISSQGSSLNQTLPQQHHSFELDGAVQVARLVLNLVHKVLARYSASAFKAECGTVRGTCEFAKACLCTTKCCSTSQHLLHKFFGQFFSPFLQNPPPPVPPRPASPARACRASAGWGTSTPSSVSTRQLPQYKSAGDIPEISRVLLQFSACTEKRFLVRTVQVLQPFTVVSFHSTPGAPSPYHSISWYISIYYGIL